MTHPHSSSPTPSRIKRFGHIVINVTNFEKCSMWYKERLGFIDSDTISSPNDSEKVIGAFMHVVSKLEHIRLQRLLTNRNLNFIFADIYQMHRP